MYAKLLLLYASLCVIGLAQVHAFFSLSLFFFVCFRYLHFGCLLSFISTVVSFTTSVCVCADVSPQRFSLLLSFDLSSFFSGIIVLHIKLLFLSRKNARHAITSSIPLVCTHITISIFNDIYFFPHLTLFSNENKFRECKEKSTHTHNPCTLFVIRVKQKE